MYNGIKYIWKQWIDECFFGGHNCPSYAYCSNTIGSFYCSCNKGYKGDGIFFAAKLYLTIFILHSVSFFNDSCLKNGEKQECY